MLAKLLTKRRPKIVFSKNKIENTKTMQIASPSSSHLSLILLEMNGGEGSALKGFVIWSTFALLVVGISWACLSEMEIVAVAQGKFVPEGKTKILQAPDQAIIRNIHVREGVFVKQGDLMIELDPTTSIADLQVMTDRLNLAQADLARLTAEYLDAKPNFASSRLSRAQITLQTAQLFASQQNNFAKLSELNSSLQSKASALRSTEAALRNAKLLLASAHEREEKVRPHVGHIISRFEYLKIQDTLSLQEREVDGQENSLIAARELVKAAELQILQYKESRKALLISEINKKESEVSAYLGESEKYKKALEYKELRAPTNGYVQNLAVTTIGGVVSPSQTLATIVPNERVLLVDAVLSNDDIGFIRIGQQADIKVDAFPFQKYGVLQGKVIWISPDAEERGKGTLDPTVTQSSPNDAAVIPVKTGLVYKVRLQINDKQPLLNNSIGAFQLAAGMTVQANIVTGKRRAIDFFIAPITQHLDQGLQAR